MSMLQVLHNFIGNLWVLLRCWRTLDISCAGTPLHMVSDLERHPLGSKGKRRFGKYVCEVFFEWSGLGVLWLMAANQLLCVHRY
jgi:hypothetical protein